MKKLLWITILSILWIPIIHAETLNFQTNCLTSYAYKINDTEALFYIYTNNVTKELIYTLSPLDPPKYNIDYSKKNDLFENLDNSLQNKIKYYLTETKNAKEFKTQMFYYINTQLLLWDTFHPEIEIELVEEPEIKEYHQQLEEKRLQKSPDWIKNYEIEEELFLEIESEYQITSDGCQIEQMDKKIGFKNCSTKANITVEEINQNKIEIYENKNAFLLEGSAPRKWTFEITKKEEENKEPEDTKTPEDTPEKEPNKKPDEPPKDENDKEKEESDSNGLEENPTNPPNKEPILEEETPQDTLANQEETWKLEKVPNTYENNFWNVYALVLLLAVLKKCK